MTHRILVVADVRLFRDGIVEALSRHADMHVVAAVATCADAARANRDHHPDVILIDSAMAECHQTIESVVRARAGSKVIVIGMGSDSRSLIDYAEAGVAGFVPREGSIDDVIQAVEHAAQGELDCSPRQAAALLCRVRELARGTQHAGERARLTLRESEVLCLIDLGLANKRIAETLGIELATVKNHVHNILEKLQCRSRAEAAARSRAVGHARPEPERSLDALRR